MGYPESLKKNVHLVGLIKKERLESSSRKREQAYCVPRRINENRLYSWEQVDLSLMPTNARLRLSFKDERW
jgi:hypothetical protein